jgi:hypothetical protein
MIYEYALEPSLVVDWALAGIGRCVGQFGLDYRRLVSDFPRDWKGQVYGDLLARFEYDYGHPDVANTLPTLDAYLQLLTECMVLRDSEIPSDAAWLDEAVREHSSRPFHAIFAASQPVTPHPDVITEKNVDNIRDPRWWLSTLKTTRKSAAEIGAALRPILQAARSIFVVDPYFDAEERRYRDTFAEIVKQATTLPRAVATLPQITLVTGVDRMFKKSEDPTNAAEEQARKVQEQNVASDMQHKVVRFLPSFVPPNVTVQLIVLRKLARGDPLHNRFVLTDVGGVVLPYGVDDYDREANHSAKDDLIPMPSGMYQERWAQYAHGVGTDIVLGPVLVCSRTSR